MPEGENDEKYCSISHRCSSCESTARDAHDRDYYVDFIIEATGTPGLEKLNQDQIKLGLAQTLSAGYAHILKTEEFLKI